ncbi:MAG: hypothetical protein U0793_34635, partial [Gemmataceae bacterium]
MEGIDRGIAGDVAGGDGANLGVGLVLAEEVVNRPGSLFEDALAHGFEQLADIGGLGGVDRGRGRGGGNGRGQGFEEGGDVGVAFVGIVTDDVDAVAVE